MLVIFFNFDIYNPKQLTDNVSINTGDVLKSFQLSGDTKAKLDEDYGKKIAQKIDGQISGTASYYWLRNLRFKKNTNIAYGRIDMVKFMDMLEMNGKFNYINLNWKSILIGHTIVSRLVGRWMNYNEKIVVTATDSLSVNEKKRQYDDAEFHLSNKELLNSLQQQAPNAPLIPQDGFIPQDKDALDLWAQEFQQLPSEILFSKGANDVLDANGWFDVLKEKMLWDSAVRLLVGTYTWMDEYGVIHVDWVKPENMIYSYCEYPDFRDSTMRGQVKALKISEIRRKYGVEFGGKLTEEELFDKIVPFAKEYQLSDKLTWMNEWNASLLRPYDEWNVDVIMAEIKSLDSDKYQMEVTNKGSLIVNKNPEKPAKKAANVKDDYWNIYELVYVRTAGVLLEWKLKENMIRPQDPKESGSVEFSYSFYMPQMQDMRNVAIPEKIEQPLEGMILAVLKIQQLVMKMKPIGSAVNYDALQEIDFGLADSTKPFDVKKHYEQTGDLYYRGRDAEGNPIPVPITELQNSGFINQLQGLVTDYQFHFQVLKDQLGEDPNLISNAVQPRVTGQNVQASLQESSNSTNYIYDAYVHCMEDTAKKISCLLKQSVSFGASAYAHLMNEEDVSGRVFNTSIKMLPTEQELQKFEAFMNEMIGANPLFIQYFDPFKAMRMAKEDVRLGELYFYQCQKKMYEGEAQKAAQNTKLNAEQQVASLQAKAQSDKELKDQEINGEISKVKATGDSQNKNYIISMVSSILSKGLPIDASIKPLIDATIQNLMIPMVVENEQARQAIIQQMQAAAMQQKGQVSQEQQQQPQQPEMQQQMPVQQQ